MTTREFNSHAPEPRRGPSARAESVDSNLADDLCALRTVTGERLPSLAETEEKLSALRRYHSERNEFVSAFKARLGRPRFATSVATASVALLLLRVPVSYDKTVGHEVNLSLTGREGL